MYPPYQIPYIPRNASGVDLVDQVNKSIALINRALVDIYGKANTGVFSGVALQSVVANYAQAFQGRPKINGVDFTGETDIDVPVLETDLVRYSGATSDVDLNDKDLLNVNSLGIGATVTSGAGLYVKGVVWVDTSGSTGSTPVQITNKPDTGYSGASPAVWVSVSVSGEAMLIPAWR